MYCMPYSTVHSVGLCGVVAVWRCMLLHVEVSELCMPSQHLYLCDGSELGRGEFSARKGQKHVVFSCKQYMFEM